MNNTSLTQKKDFKSVAYEIVDTGLIKRTQTRGGESELHYPYEQIRTNRALVLEHNKAVLIVAAVFIALALIIFISSFSDKTVEPLIALICFIIATGFSILYLKTRARKLYLHTTENVPLDFIADQPSEEVVSDFVQQLMDNRNAFLLSRYGKLNRNLQYAPQLDNLNWLLNNRVISKARYDELVEELDALFGGHVSSKPIGFSSKN